MNDATAPGRRLDPVPWLAAAGTAALVLVYCLRNGTYDVVARGEAGLLIWVALGVGWAVGVLPRATLPRWLWLAVGGFVLLAAWTTVCLRWTESDERTVVELGRVLHHAGVLLLAASLLSRSTWRAALGGLTAGLIVVAWLGLCNWLWPASIATDYTRQVFGVNRLSYPLAYFNGMATLGVMTIVAGLAWASHGPRTWLRALAALPLPGVVVMTYLTYSRGGALELGVGLLVLLAFAHQRVTLLLVGAVAAAGSAFAILALRDHPDLVRGTGSAGAGGVLRDVILTGAVSAAVAAALTVADERLRLPRRLGVPALAALGVVAVIALAVVGPGVVRRAGDSLNTTGTNSAANPTARFTTLGGARLPQFRAAVDAWKAHPVEGTGPGTYEFVWNRSPRFVAFVRDVHDLYLEALAESGVPGLIATLVVLLGMAAVVVRAAFAARAGTDRGAIAMAAATLAVFLVAAAVDWVWELTALPFVVLVAVGATGAGCSAPRRRNRAGRVLVPVAALLAMLALLPPVVSQSQIRESQAAVRDGDPSLALSRADDAVDTAPWSATAMAQKALVLEQAGDLRAAEGYVILAIEREPTNWRYPLLRSRLLAARGEVGQALRWFRRARALAPHNPALG